MIKVILEGKYNLDLPLNLEISIVEENPMFLDDKIPSPYSLSFEIPPTTNNLQCFGYAGRLTSLSVKKKLPARLFFFGIPFSTGEILLLEIEKNIKLQYKGSIDSSNVLLPLNQFVSGEYDFGAMEVLPVAPFSYDQNWWSNGYKTTMQNNAMNPQDFAIAPVRIKDIDWNGNESQLGAKNTLYQYINYFNPVTQSLCVGNPSYMHTPIFPFPFVRKIIDDGFGAYLQSNPFATGDLAKLVMITFNHPRYNIDNLYQTIYPPGVNPTPYDAILPLIEDYSIASGNPEVLIKMKSFMQAYAFNDFLKNLLKIFSMTAFPGAKYSLEFNNEVMDRDVVVNLTDKLTGNLNVTYEEGKDYNFSYSGVADPEIENSIYMFSNTIKSCFDDSMNMNLNAENVFKDQFSNQIFLLTAKLKGLQSERRIKSEIKASGLYTKPVNTGKESYEVASEVTPLNMNIEQYWWEDSNPNDIISHKHWYVPVIEKGGVSEAPKIMFHAGMAATLDNNQHQYPFLTAGNYDHFGVKRLNTSLLPDGPDGLLSKYHGKYKSWVEKDKTRVKGNFRLTPLEVKNLDIRDKILLKGRLFYIEKMEYSLMHKGISLIEMDLIEV